VEGNELVMYSLEMEGGYCKKNAKRGKAGNDRLFLRRTEGGKVGSRRRSKRTVLPKVRGEGRKGEEWYFSACMSLEQEDAYKLGEEERHNDRRAG